jgi:hypothetical protein
VRAFIKLVNRNKWIVIQLLVIKNVKNYQNTWIKQDVFYKNLIL